MTTDYRRVYCIHRWDGRPAKKRLEKKMNATDKKLITARFGECPKNVMSSSEYSRWERIFGSYSTLAAGNPYPADCPQRRACAAETAARDAQAGYWQRGQEWLTRRREFLGGYRRCADGGVLRVYDRENARRVDENDHTLASALPEFGLTFAEFSGIINPVR